VVVGEHPEQSLEIRLTKSADSLVIAWLDAKLSLVVVLFIFLSGILNKYKLIDLFNEQY
jgi:hypothetical protein